MPLRISNECAVFRGRGRVGGNTSVRRKVLIKPPIKLSKCKFQKVQRRFNPPSSAQINSINTSSNINHSPIVVVASVFHCQQGRFCLKQRKIQINTNWVKY